MVAIMSVGAGFVLAGLFRRVDDARDVFARGKPSDHLLRILAMARHTQRDENTWAPEFLHGLSSFTYGGVMREDRGVSMTEMEAAGRAGRKASCEAHRAQPGLTYFACSTLRPSFFIASPG